MTMVLGRVRGAGFALVLVNGLILGCGGAKAPAAPPPKPVATVTAAVSAPAHVPELPPDPEPALPPFRSGALAPIEEPGVLELKVLGAGNDGKFQIVAVEFPQQGGWRTWQPPFERVAAEGVPYAFVGRYAHDVGNTKLPARGPSWARARERRAVTADDVIWLRRPLEQREHDIAGELFVPAVLGGPGRHGHFHASVAHAKSDPAIREAWSSAASEDFQRHGGPFFEFAANRVLERWQPKAKTTARARPVAYVSSELSRLIDIFYNHSSDLQTVKTDLFVAHKRKSC